MMPSSGRSQPWSVDDARTLTLALLATRAAGKTLCPSEVAKALAGGPAADWRAAMPLVHAAVDQLVAQAQVRLSWKGYLLTARAGPYRIAQNDGPCDTGERTDDGQR